MTTLTADPLRFRRGPKSLKLGSGAAAGRAWQEARELVDALLEMFSATSHYFNRKPQMNPETTPTDYTRQSLIDRLRDWDDSASWKEFFSTYWKLIFSVARRAGLNEAEAEDVVQETIIAVAKKMPEFQYDRSVGTFKGYLMQLTRSRIADHFRRKSYQVQGERRPREVRVDHQIIENQPDLGGVDLAAVWEHEWKIQLLEAAMDRVRERSKPRQFQLFQLHVCKGLPARDVAVRLRAKLPEVYFAKYKISAAIKRELKRLEKSML